MLVSKRQLIFSSSQKEPDDLKWVEEALTAYERTIQLDPGYPQVHCNKGAALASLKRHEEALTAYERAIQLDPDNVYAQAGRSEIQLRLLKRK